MRAAGGTRLGMRIGEVAERSQVSERALRYYEEVGLLRPAHEAGSIRLYRDGDVIRVQRIRELKDLLGFNLEEIRKVLAAEDHLDALREQYQSNVSPREELIVEAIATLHDLREQIGAKQARLSEFSEDLDSKLKCFERLSTDAAEA